MSVSTMTAAAVDELLASGKPAAAPAPAKVKPVVKNDTGAGELVKEKPKVTPVYDPRAGRSVMPRPVQPVSEEHEYFGLADKKPVGPVIPAAPPRLLAVDGLPDVEADPDLTAARANYARLVADLTAAHAERSALEAELKIGANATPAALEKLAVEMLVSGGAYPQVQALRAVAERERQLHAACKIAAERIHPLIQTACRKRSAEAVAKLVRPKQEAVALAFVELLTRFNEMREAENVVNGAHLGQALTGLSTLIWAGTVGANDTAAWFISQGLLSRTQVLKAAPLLQGI